MSMRVSFVFLLRENVVGFLSGLAASGLLDRKYAFFRPIVLE